MSDKTTEEAAEELWIQGLESALIDANTTIAQLREENERYQWVSVEDRLPPNDSYNLMVYTKSGVVDCNICYLDSIFYDICSDRLNVEYWMFYKPPTEALTPKPPKTNG